MQVLPPLFILKPQFHSFVKLKPHTRPLGDPLLHLCLVRYLFGVQCCSWNLDEKNFKMEKTEDDEYANKDPTVETNISDFKTSCQCRSRNLVEKDLKMEKNADDEHASKDATAETNMSDFKISCKYSSWNLNKMI